MVQSNNRTSCSCSCEVIVTMIRTLSKRNSKHYTKLYICFHIFIYSQGAFVEFFVFDKTQAFYHYTFEWKDTNDTFDQVPNFFYYLVFLLYFILLFLCFFYLFFKEISLKQTFGSVLLHGLLSSLLHPSLFVILL